MQSTVWQWQPRQHEDTASSPSLRRQFGRSSRSHHCILQPRMDYLYWERASSIHSHRPDRKKKWGIAILACHSLEAGFFNAEHWKHVFIIRVFINNPIITTLRMINVAKSNVLQIVPLHKPFWCIPSPGWGPGTAPLAQCRRPTIPSRCHLRCKWQSVSRQGWTLQHSPGQQRKEPQVKKKRIKPNNPKYSP